MILFESAIKSQVTKLSYKRELQKFLQWTRIKESDGLLRLKDSQLQVMLEDYLFYLKSKVSPNSINTMFAPLQLFFEMNDREINFKKIKRMFPAKIKKSGYNAWQTVDIEKMLQETTAKRSLALVHFLASTGCRIGAIPDLKVKHISQIENCKAVLFYENTTVEYFGFLTPEASRTYDNYLEERKRDGESINEESPLFRAAYQIAIQKPKPLSYSSIKNIIHRLTWNTSKIRHKSSGKRYNIQLDHGFRKRFNTVLKLASGVNPNITEKLLGHKKGLDGTYLAPTREECFAEFAKAIPNLTIDDKERDNLKIRKLEGEKSELEKGRLEIEQMKKRIEELEFGAEARKGDYAKNMLRFLHEKNKSGEVISMLWHFLFERIGTEEEKRQFLKRAREATENGEKFDMSWFEEFKGLDLENPKGINNIA